MKVHYIDRDNGERSDCPHTLEKALHDALAVVVALPAEPDEAYAAQIRLVCETLEHATAWHLPKLTLWCVVKHYHGHDPKTGSWAPAIWCACLSREQAEAFRPALDAHYNERARQRGWATDTWTVERLSVSPEQIIRPNLTAAEYVANLA